ncbi:MAG: hypothetical protein A2Y12_11490 [Planctomycetes bacterium GWF2_42_9]|nr:MAG: hypothetical protein A2Y12_11490 [Planctomycetes bacterium GWF2_42_9]
MCCESVTRTEFRVEEKTDPAINEQFQKDIEARILYYSQRIENIQQRLNELDSEWDIERVLETQASALTVVGVLLGITACKKWFLLPAIVGGFFLQHAITGWCPPVPLFRRLGIRTMREINQERYGLKALKGDFDEINSKTDEPPQSKALKVINAVKVDDIKRAVL